MYPSNSAITTMSMASQGPGPGSTSLYTTFGSTPTLSSGFPQYGAAASAGSIFPSHVPSVNVPAVTNTGMFPQSSVPSLQQQSQDLYRARLQQQAASHLPFPLQKSASSTVSGFSQNPQAAYGPPTAPRQFTNQSYQGPPQSSFYPGSSSAAIPNMSGHPARMFTGPRPTPVPPAASPPVYRSQNASPSGLPLYEQSIHTILNPNYSKNTLNQQYPSLQQSMNLSPPLIRGHQNSWTLSKNPSQHSPQTGITAPPNKDYLSQTRQMPSATAYGPSLPSAAQIGPAYTTGEFDEKRPYVCGVCHTPFRKPLYLQLHLKGSRKKMLTDCGKTVIQNAGFDFKNPSSHSLIEALCGKNKQKCTSCKHICNDITELPYL